MYTNAAAEILFRAWFRVIVHDGTDDTIMSSIVIPNDSQWKRGEEEDTPALDTVPR